MPINQPLEGGNIVVAIILIGWIVRTETAGRHRYWKVGEVNPDRAAQIARNAAIADVARAVTRLPAHVVPAFQIAPGIITEIVWETKPVAGPFQMSASESRIRGSVAKVLGEITFDIVFRKTAKLSLKGVIG
jgi:hypothetical protein